MKKVTNENTVGYLFSIFNGKKVKVSEESNYSPFMMNRYIAVAENYKFIDLAEFMNRHLSNLSKEEHYNYLSTKINKGFYRIDVKNNFFSTAKELREFHKRISPLITHYNFAYEDVYFILNIISDKEYNKLIKILDKLNESK